jgi:V8-like Glu-specific endopeptidase
MTRRNKSFCVVPLLGLLLLLGLSTLPGMAHADFSAAGVYRNASPAVVVIFGFDSSGNGSSGTGSIVTSDGKILTNHHVIYDAKARKPYTNIKVFLKPSRITGNPEQDLKNPYSVKVIARDADLDLAVLQVVGAPRGLPVLPMGDSEAVEIGSSVAAIGHPGGGGLWTLTTGTISSSRNDGSRAIFQTDAAINPGNSGGPLLDRNSHLIGVNTFVRRVNAQGLPLEGLNYSLRSSFVRNWLASSGLRLAYARPVQQDQPAAPPRPAWQASTESAPEAAPPTPPTSSFPSTPSTPESVPTRPRPQVSIDPETGPAQSAPEMPSAPSAPSRSRDGEPRVFKGPNGEMMFGVPDQNFDLKATGKAVYQKARKNARDAFDSLEAEFE